MFITYTHVDQLKSRAKKWQVNSFQNQRRKELKEKLIHSPRAAAGARRPRRDLVLRSRPSSLTSHASTASEVEVDVEVEDEAAGGIPVSPDELALLLSEEDIDINIKVLLEEDTAAAPMKTSVASLRRDPFNSYPMDESSLIQTTVDYFTQCLAPENSHNYRDSDGGNWLLSYLFRVALQADLLFESTMLFVWCHLPSQLMVGTSPEDNDKLYMRVRGSVMQKLHRRLSVPGSCSDDITIHTVVSLMAADFFHEMDDYAELHREGLRRIVNLRGGLSDGDLQPQTKYSITATEMMCDYAIRRRIHRSPKTNITPTKQLVYPTHPFSPTLSQKLSALPSGFSDLALQTLLSNQVIDVLHRMAKTLSSMRTTTGEPTAFMKDHSIAIELMRLSMETDAKPLERAIAVLSFVFIRLVCDVACPRESQSRSHNSTRTYRSTREPVRELAGYGLASGGPGGEGEKGVFALSTIAGPHFVVWAVFVLAAAGEDYGLPTREAQDEVLWRLRRTVVVAVERRDVFLATVRKFFFHESLVPIVDELWERMMTTAAD